MVDTRACPVLATSAGTHLVFLQGRQADVVHVVPEITKTHHSVRAEKLKWATNFKHSDNENE